MERLVVLGCGKYFRKVIQKNVQEIKGFIVWVKLLRANEIRFLKSQDQRIYNEFNNVLIYHLKKMEKECR